MTDTTTLAPTDAEILVFADEHLRFIDCCNGEVLVKGELAFARAALEKWGASANGDTASPFQARVPLSAQQIAAMYLEAMGQQHMFSMVEGAVTRFTRAVEKHHGITAAQKPQAPDLIAAAEAIYALRNLDSHDLPCIEAWPDEFAALGRAITAQKETPCAPTP